MKSRIRAPSRAGGFCWRPVARGRMLPLLLVLAAVLPVGIARAEKVPRLVPLEAYARAGQFITSGVRVERKADGAVLVGRERFDAGGQPRGVAIPARLGGGFVFHQPVAISGSTNTALYRSRTWTSQLRPLALVPFTVERVEAGFDRLYLLGGGHRMALDVSSGDWLPLDPVPEVVSIEQLEFAQDGRARITAPLVGDLVTEDFGLTWHRQGDVPGTTETASSEPLPPQRTLHDESPELARRVVLSGAILGDSIVALQQGRALVLDRRSGRLSTWSVESAPEGPSIDFERTVRSCQGYPAASQGGSARLWFVCRGADSRNESVTVVLHGRREGSTLVLASAGITAGLRRTLATAPAGVLLDDACAGGAGICWMTPKSARTIPNERVDGFQGRLTHALTPQGPRRISQEGDEVVVVDPRDDSEIGRYPIPAERSLRELLAEGRWLPGATASAGSIRFWATRGQRFVGVELADESVLRVGAIQSPLRRAVLGPDRGLIWGASGFAKVSTDGGQTWADASFPYVSGDPDPNSPASSARTLVLGCGSAGCALGKWLALGWLPEDRGTRVVEPPARTPVPPPGGGRFRFTCHRTGRTSAASLDGEDLAQPRSAAWTGNRPRPFWDVPAPVTEPGDAAYAIEAEPELASLQTWGPETGRWGRRGRVRVVFRDPFALDGVHESAVTPGLFADALDAEATLGLIDRAAQRAEVQLDPSGEAGVFLVHTGHTSHLLTFAEGEAVALHAGADGTQIRNLAGAVRVRGQWYLGSIQGSRFRVFRVGSERAEEHAALSLGKSGTRGVHLVRSTSGDLGVAIEGDAGLFVYPLGFGPDAPLGEPTVVPHRSSHPPSCAPEAQGWLVERELPVSPYVELQNRPVDVARVSARSVVGYGEPCLLGLSARTRGRLGSSVVDAAPVAEGIPLVVTDFGPRGRRELFVCE